MAQNYQLRNLFPLFLLFFAYHIQGASISLSMGGVPGFDDLKKCARDCISYGGSYNIDVATECRTAKCICQPENFSLALFMLWECISEQPIESKAGPMGCGEGSQQDAAAKVLKAACKSIGYNVDNIGYEPWMITSETALATAYRTSGTSGSTGKISAASGFERQYLRMFAVVMVTTIAIPTFLFGMKFSARL